MVIYLWSTKSVLVLEGHRGDSKAADASGQKVSQEWRKKKLLSKGHARKEATAVKSLDC